MVGTVASIALVNGHIDYYTGFGSAVRAILQGLPKQVGGLFKVLADLCVVGSA